MDHYLSRKADDPEWLAKAALFHGHLGPWLIAGAMVGQDAIRRLDTPGQWKIDVSCWLPADKQRTPFTCVLDGLQCGCGATMGKRNLWMRASEEVLADGWPVIHVVRMADARRTIEGVSYIATCGLHGWMQQVTSERLEEISRQMAADDVPNLFRITSMTAREFAWTGHKPAGVEPAELARG